jgi:hypothetical protein
MKAKILLLITMAFLFGCNNKKIISIDGHTYTLIRAGQTNANGINDIELWERKGVTNRYYTPSIDGKFMHPIMK